MHPIDCELVTIDGIEHTSDYADHYQVKIREKYRKRYIKNNITINVDTRIILNYKAKRNPKYYTQFAIAPIRQQLKNHTKHITSPQTKHMTKNP